MTAVACTCGHDRQDHFLEYLGGDEVWHRGPCRWCTCDEYAPAGQGT